MSIRPLFPCSGAEDEPTVAVVGEGGIAEVVERTEEMREGSSDIP